MDSYSLADACPWARMPLPTQSITSLVRLSASALATRSTLPLRHAQDAHWQRWTSDCARRLCSSALLRRKFPKWRRDHE